MGRSAGPDPDGRSPPPDPDRHYEQRTEKRLSRQHQQSAGSCGWGLGPRLRAATTGLLPVVATRDRIRYYRARHYGWKGQAVTAWQKLTDHDRFATTPSRMDFVTDFPGTALRAAYFGIIWNLLALLFIGRYATGHAWCQLTLVVDAVEWLVCRLAPSARWAGRRIRSGWAATIGQVSGND